MPFFRRCLPLCLRRGLLLPHNSQKRLGSRICLPLSPQLGDFRGLYFLCLNLGSGNQIWASVLALGTLQTELLFLSLIFIDAKCIACLCWQMRLGGSVVNRGKIQSRHSLYSRHPSPEALSIVQTGLELTM